MAVTILEALMNADVNLQQRNKAGMLVVSIAAEQLHNAVTLLDKGYGLSDQVESLLEKHGKVEDVPEKEEPHAQ